MKFKVGNRVRLKKSSCFYDVATPNQLGNKFGTIISTVVTDDWVQVSFDRKKNYYRERELYLATKSLDILLGYMS